MALFGIKRSKNVDLVNCMVSSFGIARFCFTHPIIGQPESDTIGHAKWVLEKLRDIREEDYMVYRAILQLYENDIKEAVKVYRESRN